MRKGIFKEAGARAEVDIISDVTNREGMRTVELVVTKVLRESPMYGPLPVQPFTVGAKRGQEHHVGWHLNVLTHTVEPDNKPSTYDGIFKEGGL